MSEYSKEKLIEDLNILAESKVMKKKILIDCYEEIEVALKNGASLEEVLLAIKNRTGQKIHTRYAYSILKEERERTSRLSKTKTKIEVQKKEEVEVSKSEPLKIVEAENQKVETKNSKDYASIPINELPEMIKPYAMISIDGIEYDVRQTNPPYETFGSSVDEFEFAGKMKEAGYEMKSEEYKKHFSVLMAQKKLRRKYYDANLSFKSAVIRHEKSSD